MSSQLSIIDQREIENRIFTFRSVQIMIDSDLAELYGVETKVLNQAVKRNIEIGSSLKDIGKKWFAFSRMDSFTNEVLNKLK